MTSSSVSAVCASPAGKPIPQWSGDERDAFDTLRKHYPDWLDPPGEDTLDGHIGDWLTAIGNQRSIDERIEKIHQDKEKLRRDKVQRFLEEKRKAVIAQLDDLLEDVTMKHEELRTSDLGKIRHEKQIVEEVMEDAEDSLVDAWADLIEGVKRNMGADLRDSIKQITKEAKEDIRRAFKQRESAGLLDKFKNLFGGKLEEDLEEGIDGYIQDMSDAIDEQLPDVEGMLGHSFARKAIKEMLRTFVSELRGQAALKISPRRIKPVLRGTINGILKKARSEMEKLSDREDKFEAKEYSNIQ